LSPVRVLYFWLPRILQKKAGVIIRPMPELQWYGPKQFSGCPAKGTRRTFPLRQAIRTGQMLAKRRLSFSAQSPFAPAK
jgi:hypothetical protein